ncbi:AlpA family phage regulatory protein [Alicycliphilus denitrificans]|uniref:AlpA family phage regulatory protein n=1 Tax=Alicycliphilus denitrificans TaxID=179636 RepID=A0A858ZP38_9BURK|nr:AlpA family phage regulatory protein [Alicycliphilus denitrificans]QKD42547.1 AlpA family phage regulatory protein [Alicycliphilus denitrificans]
MPHTRDSAASSSDAEPAFYRLADVIRITALSRSSIYRRIAAGEFPPQVSLGGRATGWRREALQAWIGDPSGFRPLTTAKVRHTSSGARVRHIAAPAESQFRHG